jgi:hypothetical protein
MRLPINICSEETIVDPSNSSITKNENLSSKISKISRELLAYLQDTNFPYFSQILLLSALPHFNSKLDDVKVPSKKILEDTLKINITTFKEKIQKYKKSLQSLGLEIELVGKKYVKQIIFRFSDQMKEKIAASKKGYTYLREDFVTWFKGLVTKYPIQRDSSTQNFFILSIIASTWDTTDIMTVGIKKLAERIGLHNLIKKREQTKIKETLTKYLGYLEQEGVIINSEVAQPLQIRFKVLNVNSQKKAEKLQQKEEKAKDTKETTQETKKVVNIIKKPTVSNTPTSNNHPPISPTSTKPPTQRPKKVPKGFGDRLKKQK